MLNHHFSFYAVILFIVSSSLFAQGGKGKIAGKIIDKSNGEDLIGAVVQIDGTNVGAATDIEGKYVISIEPGIYTVILSYISYKTEKIQGVEVKAGQVTYLNFAMKEDVQEIEEVVITYTVEKSSTEALLIERKNTAQVSDGVSAELIRKTPDRSASDVLKRVTGASIQEGKFAIIRGMNDRYNAGYLNGAPLPSTEADRKAFAFDIIPANLLDNIQIIKAATPDVIGDFAGGIIKINTKAVPESFTQSFNLSGTYHSLTTFKNFETYNKASIEATLGITPEYKKQPNFEQPSKYKGPVPTLQERQNNVANLKRLNHSWDKRTFNALPNLRMGYSLGTPLEIGKMKAGLVTTLNYNRSYRYFEGKVAELFVEDGRLDKSLSEKNYTYNTNFGGLFNFTLRPTSKHSLKFNNFYNIVSDVRTSMREGITSVRNTNEGKFFLDQELYSRLYSGQLGGDHVIGDNWLKVNWLGSVSKIKRTLPGMRTAVYDRDYSDPDNTFSIVNSDLNGSGTGISFSNLDETVSSISSDVTLPLNFVKNIKTDIKVGGLHQRRVRTFAFDYYGGFGGFIPNPITTNPSEDLKTANIQNPNISPGYLLWNNSTFVMDTYDAWSELNAAHWMLDQKVFEKLRLVYGIRAEYFRQRIRTANVDRNTLQVYQGDPVFLPSLNLNYSITDKSNLRAALYRTVNRPEFREIAYLPFYTFALNSEVRGNESLQSAKINNYELRFEHYPSANQIVSFGIFLKDLANPIEFTIDRNTTTLRTLYYRNEKSARIYGTEFEVRKNLDFILDTKFFQNFTLFSNLALIKSTIVFEPSTSLSEVDRPLQGQSPYVMNFGMQYEDAENGWNTSLVLNRIGRRLAIVGVPRYQSYGFDIYENPRTVIDFQISKTIKKVELRMVLGDILAQDLIFYQDQNKSGKFEEGQDFVSFRYNYGYTVSLGLNYKF